MRVLSQTILDRTLRSGLKTKLIWVAGLYTE